jgi:hypothetical protein
MLSVIEKDRRSQAWGEQASRLYRTASLRVPVPGVSSRGGRFVWKGFGSWRMLWPMLWHRVGHPAGQAGRLFSPFCGFCRSFFLLTRKLTYELD